MKPTLLAFLMLGLCHTVLATEPEPVTASAAAASISAPAGPAQTGPDVTAENCGSVALTTAGLEGLLNSTQAPPAIKCSTTVCSGSLPCCVPYACVTGRCLID